MQVACMAGARRGGGMGKIRRTLERKNSAKEGGGGSYPLLPRAPRLLFAHFPLPFPLLVPATQAIVQVE